MIIKLFNRDNANLYLEKVRDTEEKGISEWKLKVDPKHEYCLKYMRMGEDYDVDEDNKIKWKNIVMIDPSGGPYLEISDELEKGKYKIVKFIDETTMLLSERNND